MLTKRQDWKASLKFNGFRNRVFHWVLPFVFIEIERAEHSPDRCLRCSFLTKKSVTASSSFPQQLNYYRNGFLIFSLLPWRKHADGRWGGHGKTWLGKGWPDPAGSRSWCLNRHLVTAGDFIPLPFWGQTQPSSPAPAKPQSLHICYLLPVSRRNCVHVCGSAPAQFPPLSPPLPSISMSLTPFWELFLEMSQPNSCLSITCSPLFG